MNIPSDILNAIDSNSYTCPICKRKIYPKIDDVDFSNETISLSNDMCDFRGGLGNKVMTNKVCPECAKTFCKDPPELNDEWCDMIRNFYKYECCKPDNQNYHPWVATRGLGKTKITMTQYIIGLDIPYEEKLGWMKKIWGSSNDD